MNLVKGIHGFKNKSEVVNFIIRAYDDEILDLELNPEYVKKVQQRKEEPAIKVKDLRTRYGKK